MLKRALCVLLITVFTIGVMGCSNENDDLQDVKSKPVKVLELEEQNIPVVLNYLGRVDSSEAKKYSFKSSGLVAAIHVEKGQKISKDQKLVQLDTQDLMYSSEAARTQMNALQAQYDKAVNGASKEEITKVELNVKKARDAYGYSKDFHDKAKILYDSGTISRDAFDKAKLDFDIKSSDLEQAMAAEQEIKKGIREEDKNNLLNQLESAKINYESKKSIMENAELKSDTEGYVIDVLVKQGELVAAGTPVVAVRSSQLAVNIGIMQEDLHKIDLGTQTKIGIDSRTYTGRVVKIDQVPDKQTWTYNVQVEVPDNTLNIGAIAKVAIEMEDAKGIWIPITCIMNNGEDYVFSVVEGKAVKKNISMEQTQGSLVLVKGLMAGDNVVVEGMKPLKSGDRIEIKK